MPDDPKQKRPMPPSYCGYCGVYLIGGATVHAEDCPFYPISYQALMRDEKIAPEFKQDMKSAGEAEDEKS